MDGWNAVRAERLRSVITDIDMPRMDGIELVSLMRRDNPTCKSLPVMIVSYKDREEDRRRGLDAGADYYLTKGSFHDDALLDAVVDLIGGARGMKIGIVNDMPMAVEALRRALALEPAHEVVWIAAQRRRGGANVCAECTPDLILMDLIMPVMDGVEATRRIMAETPCAILIVTVERAAAMSTGCSRRWATARSMWSIRRRSARAIRERPRHRCCARSDHHRLADRRTRQPACNQRRPMLRSSAQRQAWWRSVRPPVGRRRWTVLLKSLPARLSRRPS